MFSNKIGHVLLVVLGIVMFFTFTFFIFLLLNVIAHDFYTSVETWHKFNSIFEIITNVMAIIIFIFWVYFLHKDLNAQFDSYITQPAHAIFLVIIPYLNLWGIWKVFTVIAQAFETEDKYIQEKGKALHQILPWFSFFMGFILFKRVMEKHLDEQVYLILWGIVAVALSYLWFKITWIVIKSLDYKFKNKVPAPDEKIVQI